jgi:DNA-binding transcriptional LysR family regulator
MEAVTLEWQQLEHFATLAKVQHFTRAAEELMMSQPALSRSIAKLEAELGVPLLDRDGRTVRLNRYGAQFARRVDRVLSEIEAGKEELLQALDPEGGTVSLSFLKSLGLTAVPDILSAFTALWPRISFQLFQDSTRMMLDRLEQGDVDVVISSMTETRKGIEWEELWEERLFAYLPRSHPLAQEQEVQVSELAQAPFIAMKQGYGLRTITDQLFGQLQAVPRILFEGEEVMTALGLVAAGLGVSLLPDIRNPYGDQVVKRPIAGTGCVRQIGMAWRRDGWLPPAATRFRAFVMERYGGEEQGDASNWK